MGKLERDYQAGLIDRMERRFPGCLIQKLDTQYRQGIPDLLILHGPYWAILEVKRKRPTKASDFEPNQEWYIEQLNQMSFSACIYPENEEDVLHEMELAFRPRRAARVLVRQ